MAKFQVLTGKALTNAIAGRAKAVASFTEREHQLAYSALNHVELHNDPKYLNALLAVTPANYRKGLIDWSKAFGKVGFNAETREFEFAKGKKSDMESALAIAPANYQRETKGGEKEFDEVKFIESAIKRLTDKNADPRTIKAMQGVLVVAKAAHLSVVPSTPKAAKPAKAAKAEAVAPVAEAA